MNLSELTPGDRQAVETFAAFLKGDVAVCAVCMAVECRQSARCCEACPGWHVQTDGPPPAVRVQVPE